MVWIILIILISGGLKSCLQVDKPKVCQLTTDMWPAVDWNWLTNFGLYPKPKNKI